MEPVTVPSNTMKAMLDLHKSLLKHYVEIEGLPQFPLNLQLKKSQKLIKDFMGRFVEELSESYDCLVNAFNAIDADNKDEAKHWIKEYNIELSDALHFFTEILIFVGIEDDTLDAMLEKRLEAMGLDNTHLYQRGLPFKTLFNYVHFTDDDQAASWHRRPDNFHIFTFEEAMVNPKNAAGRLSSLPMLEEYSTYLWGTTHLFFKAANLLKNKDWVQTDKELNEMQFQEYLLDGIIMFFRFLYFTELREVPMYNVYLVKNQINHQRIKDKY